MIDDENAFQREVLRVMACGSPSRGDDLYGMKIDFSLLLGLDELEESTIAIRTTADVDKLILVDCSPAEGVSLGQAAEAVRQVWFGRLRYQSIEAHHVAVGDDQAVLRFVTQTEPGGLYVTGQVRVRPR